MMIPMGFFHRLAPLNCSSSVGVTSISTVLRDPKDGAVVIAAENQGLLLNCLYGACSSSTEAPLGGSPGPIPGIGLAMV